MHPKNILYISALLIALTISHVSAQSVIISAKTDSAAIWMGDQTAIKLEIVQDKNADVSLLLPKDTLTTGVEIVSITTGDTTDIKNNRIQVKRELIITSFDSGFYYIPPFKCVLKKDTFETSPLSLKVVPVDVDTLKMEIKDIKTVQSPRFVLLDFIPGYVWIILAVLLLLSGGIYLYMRYRKKSGTAQLSEEDAIPPYEKAKRRLLQLKEDKLWQGGQEKLYYTRLTDILREYIDARFSINAMEMTSTQILNALRSNSDAKIAESQMKQILDVADFVKFAKMRPLADDNESTMRYALDFVEETTPRVEEQVQAEGESNKKQQVKTE